MPLSDIARAAENRIYRDVIPVLKARGWRPRVIGYEGYGSAGERGSMARSGLEAAIDMIENEAYFISAKRR